MAEDKSTFDIYDDKGNKVATAQPSPVVLKDLTPSTTYKGYTASYANGTVKTPLENILTKAPVVVAVTGVTFDKTALTVNVGDTFKLTATVAPADATDPSLTWKSSDETVATIANDGTGATLKAGTADITATSKDGSIVATATVTVVEPAPKVDSIETTDTTATITLE